MSALNDSSVSGVSRKRRAVWSAVFLLVVSLSLYFRSYELLPRSDISPQQKREMAENFVRQSLHKQILTQMQASGSQVPEALRSNFAAQQVEALVQSDRRQFDETVDRFIASMPPSLRKVSSRHYLLESDPYHFMAQVQNLLETGKVAERIENGKFLDKLRCYPHGYWVPFGAQPYVGAAVYRILGIFKPGIELMEGLGYVPLILVVLGLGAFFFLCSTLGFGPGASAAAALTMSLSPIYLQRSSYGWFDTDPFNHLFPNLILALFFLALPSDKKRASVLAAAAGAVTGLYVLFWLGWPFIFLLVSGMSFVFLLRFWLRRDAALRGVPFFLPVYVLSTAAAGILAAGPATFTEFIFRGARYIGEFAVLEPDTWPNIFLMVGETTSVSLKRLIFLTGNFVTCLFMLAGAVSIFWIRRRKALGLFAYRWTALFLMAVPLLLLSFGTERFAVLLVTPLALFTGLAVESAGYYLKEKAEAWAGTAAGWKARLISGWRGLWLASVFLILLPMQFLFAHALALKSEPIMNDTWYAAMAELRDKTPEGSVVYSWWPPGYFISTLARRNVFADGGNQDLPGSYWLARVFMATTEEEALGVMRMMNSSGVEAQEKLKAAGLKLAPAMDLLNQILPLDAADARRVLQQHLDGTTAREVLALTHEGNFKVPTYLFIYSEMVEKNLAMSVFARWNFHKAALIQKAASEGKGFLGIFGARRADSIQQFLASSDGILRYMPEAPLEKRDGNLLFFRGGILVDWENKKALIQKPAEGVNGQVRSLFFAEQGEFREAEGGAGTLNISVLVYEQEGQLYAVMADRELIRSMLFRLYYLKGAGLRHFKPVYEKTGEVPPMTVQIIETRWDAAEPAQA